MNGAADAHEGRVIAMRPRHRPHRALRILLIVIAALLGLAIVIRLVLDPIATHETRKSLGKLHGLAGDFSRVHVTVLPPGYAIQHLKLVEDPRGDADVKAVKQPLLYVDRAHLGVSLHDLVRGHLVASLRLEHPKVTFTQPPPTEKKPPAKAPDLSAQLAQAPPLRVARVEMMGGEVSFRARVNDEHPTLWIHDIDMTAENLATRRGDAHGRPATVSLRGLVGRSGELTLFVSADPLARPLSFAGETSLRGLRAAELYQFLAAADTNLQATQGTIDLFATFRSENGAITGAVKPVLKNIEVRSTDEGLWQRAKAWLADKAVELSSDRVPGRNAVATTVPIKGKLTNPDIQLWPAVLGVVRNAYVAGLESGFATMPPPSANEKQSLWQQTKDALKKDAGPPKAQPTKPTPKEK